MLRFNDIADRVLEYDPECDLTLLQRAYVFSAKVHEGQERLSGEPYLIHPLEVAGILAEMRLDAVTIAAGLLHDTVEDTLATVEELRDRFGDEVAFLVEGLTKLSKLEWKSAKERQAENFRKMLIAMSKDIRILLIKLADRLHNMRTLQFMPEDSRRRVAEETEGIYVPLAHRLGIDWVRRELADLAFRALQPDASGELEKKLRGSRKQREKYVEEVIGILSAKLTAAGIQAELRGRPKELASIHHKMETQGITLDDIYDVIAFRIVLDGGREACYAALGIVHSTWPPVPGRFKDYVALPKPNGYQSLHTTVIGPYGERMEVQLRTQEMHRHAEFGIAAHWKYKDEGGRSARDDAKFDWLRQLMERQQELDDPHEFLDVVKVDLFPDATFVFTPKGDVINLPKGATPVDFAYGIHSQVGERCQGARVNGKMVPLRHKLRDGDTVEIVTSASQRPNKDWLDFVVSGKARSKIRHAIRLAENARARELGHGLLDREMRRAGLSLARALEGGDLVEPARVRARGAVDDLLAAVGYGRIPPATVVRDLKPDWAPEPEAVREKPARGPKLLEMFRRPPKSSKTGIRVEGQGDVLVRFGNCCTPLPGDDVVGFVTRGRGVTVHQKDCRVVFHLDPQRRVDVEWEGDAQVAHRIKMKVVSRDEPGLLAKITKTISAAGINIGAARVSTHADRTATQSFDLWVSDVRTLASVMKEIQRIKGILSVERVRA
ncbi:MAG TPA: bifunctional (p)ppGpp synthetase/guanosine-3',5'-bis(diphosphate) 3'-pyrophosphohydrolase [Myxococcota bacterium]|nr:bifunctional (p)ppGpp synthetase/guanosine-3',5'-bis(diphosphate) 3'-pyrophosphohydrolase [Myxococcota bacterium]